MRNLIIGLALLILTTVLYRAATAPKGASQMASANKRSPKSRSLTMSSSMGAKTSLASSKLRCEVQDCVLTLSYEPRKKCQGGDIDAIRMSFRALGVQAGLILTVESLHSAEAPLLVQHLAINELESPFQREFTIPAWKAPKLLGVFICRDLSGHGRCDGKHYADGSATLIRDALVKSSKPGAIPDDMIYFFQFLLLDAEGTIAVASSMDTDSLQDVVFAQRQKYLADRLTPDAGKHVALVMKSIMNMSRSLRSMPLELSASTVRAVLPYRDRDTSRCKPNEIPPDILKQVQARIRDSGHR